MPYTAIVLTEDSARHLRKRAEALVGHSTTWEVICHHVTLHLGNPTPDEVKMLDLSFQITVDGIGTSDKAVAVRVKRICTNAGFDITSVNKVPHITLLVNRSGGGKPKDSNEIKNWTTDGKETTYFGKMQFIP